MKFQVYLTENTSNLMKYINQVNENLKKIGIKYNPKSKRFEQVSRNPFNNFVFFTDDRKGSIEFKIKDTSISELQKVFTTENEKERKDIVKTLRDISIEFNKLNEILDVHKVYMR